MAKPGADSFPSTLGRRHLAASASAWLFLVGLDGLEPTTSVLSGPRSNRLSYRPTVERRGLGHLMIISVDSGPYNGYRLSVVLDSRREFAWPGSAEPAPTDPGARLGRGGRLRGLGLQPAAGPWGTCAGRRGLAGGRPLGRGDSTSTLVREDAPRISWQIADLHYDFTTALDRVSGGSNH